MFYSYLCTLIRGEHFILKLLKFKIKIIAESVGSFSFTLFQYIFVYILYEYILYCTNNNMVGEIHLNYILKLHVALQNYFFLMQPETGK